MEISPQRVRSAEFKTVRKGADPEEVKVFLNDVADELERAQNQSTAMEARARAAVARLQEVSESGKSAAPAPVDVSADEAETISRTLVLAQRTADTAIAEARSEAARIVGAAKDEAATTLDSTREMAAQLLDEARIEARRLGEAERLALAGEVDSLKARRDFLESDVQQLELFLTEQRNRLRQAATSLIDITERVPAGLGETRPPLLSASDDGAASGEPDVDDDLVIMTDVAEFADDDADDTDLDESAPDDLEGDDSDHVDEPTRAMPTVDGDDRRGDDDRRDDDGDVRDDDFRFSFDDDRA